jgi:glycerol-3-phosphate cytidylyltransferase-like family protein
LILTSGCFDGLHEGHLAFLAAVQTLAYSDDGPCDEVRVALASDDYIRAIKHREPHELYDERRKNLFRLDVLLSVTPHDQPSAADVIRKLRPKWFVKGVDSAGRLPHDVVQACRDVNALIVFVDHGVTVHTSDAH